MRDIINTLREEFASVWALLNDTEVFLNRIGTFDEYELDFRIWRANIIQHRNNQDIVKDIRSEIAALRSALRKEGYDLRLGSKDLEVHSFMNDDAPRYGYTRMTLIIGHDDVFYITGESNHQELLRYLERRLDVAHAGNIGDAHHLWYRWKDNVLQLCGADSESKDDYEKFRAFAMTNKIFLLKKFRNL